MLTVQKEVKKSVFVEGVRFSNEPEMLLYTRYEHGNRPVRVGQATDGETYYEVTTRSDDSSGVRVERFSSARALMRAIYGHDVHMPFDRYFRLGRYRLAGRASGQADLLTLLDQVPPSSSRRTDVVVHARAKRELLGATPIVLDEESQGLRELLDALGGTEVLAREMPKLPASVEFELDTAFKLELDRLEGVVGIDLGATSDRKGAKYRADEVRKLLWRGFAGKMLGQGYDPEDVLQEVHRGLLVRNRGRCPWDERKSTFGHYVHMVISCVLTNYHRKQARRVDRDAIPLETRDGDDTGDVGQWGSCNIEHGSEVGDRLALEGLARWLEGVEEEAPEAVLGKEILPLVAAGYQRGEIVRETQSKPSMVSRALAWLRAQSAAWAMTGGLEGVVPVKYRGV